MKNTLVLGLMGLGLVLSACASTPEPAKKKTANSTPPTSIAALLGLGPSLSQAEFTKRLEAASKFPLGSRENPVRVNMPTGQREYLSRLVCENLQTPEFSRAGSYGAGPYDSIIDMYVVKCPGSQPANSEIFMDMYFPGHVEDEAVNGFEIR